MPHALEIAGGSDRAPAHVAADTVLHVLRLRGSGVEGGGSAGRSAPS